MAQGPFSLPFPYPDPGATVEIYLWTGETIKGILLDYDEETTTVLLYDSKGNFTGRKRVIKNSDKMGL